uniref:CDGSH iron-sulfur domain-containing protein 2 n=1 Tax=Equus caballus TaxID=9796 RepID=A0A9L0TJ72_HORSE
MVLESVARIVKVQLPAYLKRLPVPESISGFARLTGCSLVVEREESSSSRAPGSGRPGSWRGGARGAWARTDGRGLLSEWLRLLPFLGVLALLGYLAVRPFLPKKKQQKDSLINLKIQKENPKVVNEINIEDLCLTKAAYCRCWRSKTFPACDGSHNKHNELTGDNVGPLILKKKEV